MTDKPPPIRFVQMKTDFDPACQCGLCEQRQDAEEIIKELLEVANGFAIWAGIEGMPDDHPLWEKYDAAVAKAEGKP